MTDQIKVITNHHERPVLYWHMLTDKERAEFDYLDTDLKREEAEFVRYKGNAHDLNEFVRPPDILKGWDGYQSDSYFSGLVLRWPRDGEEIVTEYVIMGRYFV